MSELIVAVGSTNPSKVKAVEAVVYEAFPGARVVPIAVPSGVSEQPMSTAETEQGARQRARAALVTAAGATFGVGLEGGVEFTANDTCDVVNCCAVASDDGSTYIAWGVRFPLPPVVAQRLRTGEQLGKIMDELSGIPDSAKSLGAVGIFSNRLLTRDMMWQAAVTCAFMPYFHPELYRPGAVPGD